MAADTLYLETGSTDPAYNLAFEEVVLQNRREGNTLLLWQNDHAVVIGQNQNAEEEINHAFVEAHGIRVVRRMTGGGAVYHDLGNLNYSWMTDVENAGAITYQQFTRPVVEALRGLEWPRRHPGATIFWWRGARFPARPRDFWEREFCIMVRCCLTPTRR